MTARLVVLVVTLALVACSPGGGADSAVDYLGEYGGSLEVYQRILSMTSCDELQGEFDRAAANNDAAEPGTPQHRQTTGYMAAADDQMRSTGCYGS